MDALTFATRHDYNCELCYRAGERYCLCQVRDESDCVCEAREKNLTLQPDLSSERSVDSLSLH